MYNINIYDICIYMIYIYIYVKHMYIYIYVNHIYICVICIYIYMHNINICIIYIYTCGPKTVPVKRTFLNIAIVGWSGVGWGGMLMFLVLRT